MERIQAAIAKARQSRGAADSAPRQVPATQTAAWEGLPRHTIDSHQMERMRLHSDAEGGHDFAAFDVLRTRTLKLMRARGWKRLAITSPSAGCGKSTVSLNLGFSLTRREDVSTILIEADLRRPSLAYKIGLRSAQDVRRVLSMEAPLEEHAVRLADRFAIATGRYQRVTTEVLQSPRVAQSLEEVERRYAPTLMLFDTPPLMIGDDTIAFLQNVDCVILVAAAEQTTIKEIDACEREIAEHTNMLGVVLNKCEFIEEKYSYDYYT
jgi:Mrp family chromosome partitioning ATPase